ncbi:DNA (cytosine-5-)-methyltransferase (plasmid) [Arthrobacter citreus]|uniref:Cytosine-specific methyltransferase n=1 Tax=Arthrobacter citreus TaxID=1670 RepID=E3VX90_9MICC|nr:M.AciI [Arthrobacter citreus]QKE76207.1 DNA (cytosine-5-)-methyltransferase [Arthrobacter citreus]
MTIKNELFSSLFDNKKTGLKSYKVVSLFSGIGGFELGLKYSSLSSHVIFSSEIDKFAQQSYLANFPNHNLVGDITKIDEQEIPDHDILMGGFPCQAFSIAGNRHGFEDTRGTLFFNVARILNAKKPKVVFLENVKNLVSHDDSRTIHVILRTLNDLGYTVDFSIINSNEAGLPQNRDRTYIVGIKDFPTEKFEEDKRSKKISCLKKELNELEFHGFNFFNNVNFYNESQIISDILDDIVDKKYYFNSEKMKRFLSTINIDEVNEPVSKIVKVLDLPRETHNDNERQRRVYSVNGISPTILARSDSTKIIVNKDGELAIRKFTPIENFRVQGFDKEFTDTLKHAGISDTQLYKQSGNAVSPPVITGIANHISEVLSDLEEKRMTKFSFIDLFSGIGGFRLALEKNGGTCLFSSDIDKYARETYFNNFGEMPSGDITKIASENIPFHDILCAGFPCQPFSIAGKRLGFEDTRGTLFFDVARIIKDKRPKAFILENVAGIVSHDHGNTLDTISNILEDLNYTFEWKLMNAKDYGVPQNRNRWYCVGINNDLGVVSTSMNSEFFPEKEELTTFIDSFIETTFLPTYEVSEIAQKNMNAFIEEFKNSPRYNPNHLIIANNIRPSKVGFSSTGISPCLTAKMGTGGNNVPVLFEYNRKLTERECLKIMGFPQSYKIKENYSQAYKQIGNSVVVPIIEKIVENLIRLLKI